MCKNQSVNVSAYLIVLLTRKWWKYIQSIRVHSNVQFLSLDGRIYFIIFLNEIYENMRRKYFKGCLIPSSTLHHVSKII